MRLGQRVDVRAAAQRTANRRAVARGEFQPDAERLQNQQNVGEQNRRVHPEAFHRLDGDLRGQVGRLAEFEKRDARAQRPIFGHVAAGLAHEPDGRERRRLPSTRPQKDRGFSRRHAQPASGAEQRGDRLGQSQRRNHADRRRGFRLRGGEAGFLEAAGEAEGIDEGLRHGGAPTRGT